MVLNGPHVLNGLRTLKNLRKAYVAKDCVSHQQPCECYILEADAQPQASLQMTITVLEFL